MRATWVSLNIHHSCARTRGAQLTAGYTIYSALSRLAWRASTPDGTHTRAWRPSTIVTNAPRTTTAVTSRNPGIVTRSSRLRRSTRGRVRSRTRLAPSALPLGPLFIARTDRHATRLTNQPTNRTAAVLPVPSCKLGICDK